MLEFSVMQSRNALGHQRHLVDRETEPGKVLDDRRPAIIQIALAVAEQAEVIDEAHMGQTTQRAGHEPIVGSN